MFPEETRPGCRFLSCSLSVTEKGHSGQQKGGNFNHSAKKGRYSATPLCRSPIQVASKTSQLVLFTTKAKVEDKCTHRSALRLTEVTAEFHQDSQSTRKSEDLEAFE